MSESKKKNEILSKLKACCQILEDKKAEDLKILDLRGKSSITDYFIIATGKSVPHLKALHNSLEEVLKEKQIDVLGMEAKPQSGWLVIDAFDFIIHILLPEMRDYYRLESLWKDAREVELKKGV